MTIYQTNDAPLRTALKVNGLFSGATGLACLLGSASLAGLLFQREFSVLGLPASSLIFELGIGLLVFAVLVLFTARQAIVSRSKAKLITALDVSWVAGSAFLLLAFSDYFSGPGTVITIGVAVAVLIFAIEQALGLAMLYQGSNDIAATRHGANLTLTASTTTNASPERVWQVMSDQEGYAAVADNISRIEVVAGQGQGQGQGMIRKCFDNEGRSWSETCSAWDEGRAFAFRVHTEAADYPYPIAGLDGEWSLIPESGTTRIRMIFRVTAKPGVLNRLIFTMMAAPFAGTCDRLLDNWVARMEGEAALQTPETRKLPARTQPA